METLFSKKLLVARHKAGFSLQDLADRMGEAAVSRQALSKYERGEMMPDSKVLLALATALGVRVDYFFQEQETEVALTGVSYRKASSRITRKMQLSIETEVAALVAKYLSIQHTLDIQEVKSYFTYSQEVATTEDAEQAAIQLRETWQIGYDPIPDVVEMLEDKGYAVFDIPAEDGFDGMKAKAGSLNIIALRKIHHASELVQRRFTALHELAHHSLRFADDITEKQEEKLCHAFASAVLYPREMALRDLHKSRFHFYEQELANIKRRWGISIPALFSRALQLGIIREGTYRHFLINYKQREYHKSGQEPGHFQGNEQPVKFQQWVLYGLAQEALTFQEAAQYLNISAWNLRSTFHRIV